MEESTPTAADRLRWTTTAEEAAVPTLFGRPPERVTHPEFEGMEFLHVRSKSIINEVPAAAHLPFRYTINVYRGCSHACVFCFARPTHEYLDLDSGRDFERVIVVKINAVELLRAELRPRRWAGEHIAMGTNTDPYQRCEGRYRLTRGVIETLVGASNPFSILTKSSLVLRDLDVLSAANERADVSVSFSIPTLDPEVWAATEPGTPHPRSRIEAVAELRAAGIRSGVMLAPIIPGISDDPEQLREVIAAAIDAGASSISPIVLHLRPGVKDVFMPWLEGARPDLVARYQDLYPRAYAPIDERRRIQRMVRDLIGELGGPVASPSRRRDRTGRHAATPSGPEATQLSLL